MNGAKKFHSPDGPAFKTGELWEGSSGHVCKIIRTERYGVDKWDVDVFYFYLTDRTKREIRKNTWDFQVRHQHQADKEI